MPTKSPIFDPSSLDFFLLETLLWEPHKGYFLLEEHLQRLEHSASFFGYSYSQKQLSFRLDELSSSLPALPHKVRLRLAKDGSHQLSFSSITTQKGSDKPSSSTPLVQCALAQKPVESNDLFLRHKTTHREVYKQAKESAPHAEDVILFNERRDITETCIGNIVLQFGRKLYTPPLSSGLLAGTMRRFLLETRTIQEKTMHLEQLKQCDAAFVINSVRKWRRIVLLEDSKGSKTEGV